MDDADYTIRFDDISEAPSRVQLVNRRNRATFPLLLKVDDTQLLPGALIQMPPHLADLIDLAISVYVADRLAVRHGDRQCRIHVDIPIRCPEAFEAPSYRERLESALYWYTGDKWTFGFRNRIETGRLSEIQSALVTSRHPSFTEVALWSGGLDSLAGLCNRVFANPQTSFLLFGSGDNNYIQNRQREIYNAVRRKVTPLVGLVQLTWQLTDQWNLERNPVSRSRGFLFVLLGSVFAYLQGVDTLYVYENGIGAINLPFRGSELGIDHSRAVHPKSLVRMEQLVSPFLGDHFRIENPFLFQTKAQMCTILRERNLTDMVVETTTCDRLQRNPDQLSQCGWCSSCLMRRQALAAAGIDDQTVYSTAHDQLQGQSLRSEQQDPFYAMENQVNLLQGILGTQSSAIDLQKHYGDLAAVVNIVSERQGRDPAAVGQDLANLYRRYSDEWMSVRTSTGRGII